MLGYVLFPNHTEAMRLYDRLKREKVRCTMAPTPRECSVFCGVSVRLEQVADIPRVEEYARQEGVTVDRIEQLPVPGKSIW